MRGTDTKNHIKQVALQLFAQHGVENVSVRDILAAADQRSGGSLHYHFGGKEGLVHELVADGARVFDEARIRKLNALEAATPRPTLRDILRIITNPFSGSEAQAATEPGYSALIHSLLVDQYDALLEGAEGLDVGYRRCIEHIRALLPGLPRRLFNQRMRLMMLFLFSLSSARERAAPETVWGRFWKDPASEANLLDCLEGMLAEPASSEVLALTGDAEAAQVKPAAPGRARAGTRRR
jgi:AcrR family transcriptional regulator